MSEPDPSGLRELRDDLTMVIAYLEGLASIQARHQALWDALLRISEERAWTGDHLPRGAFSRDVVKAIEERDPDRMRGLLSALVEGRLRRSPHVVHYCASQREMLEKLGYKSLSYPGKLEQLQDDKLIDFFRLPDGTYQLDILKPGAYKRKRG